MYGNYINTEHSIDSVNVLFLHRYPGIVLEQLWVGMLDMLKYTVHILQHRKLPDS